MTDQPHQQALFFFGDGHADGGNDLKHLVGGKGASLAEMTRAGLNVPPGFTISAECCRHYFERGRQWPEGLREELRRGIAWLEQKTGRHFGRGDNPLLVAVRSGAAVSMPGMMDTVLNVGLNADDPFAVLCQAVEAVFQSWESERAVTYRRHHKIEGVVGTAVTVQAMCPSEVSGVLFTAHPVDPALPQMVLESWYGLGEAIVQGQVTPDRFVIDRASGNIVAREIQQQRAEASLSDALVHELAGLGQRVEAYFGHPCDIEWGLAGGKFYLLQARPIKRQQPANAVDLERVRQEEIARLKALAAPEGTVWSRIILYEVLQQPTPMTWSIVQKLMSGGGGYGLSYRDLGYAPDPALDEVGTFDLVCGRPYCNLSREPKLQFAGQPYEHPFATLKKEPERALHPLAVPNLARASWKFWLLLPVLAVSAGFKEAKRDRLKRTFAKRFREEILPPYLAETAAAAQTDLSKLEPAALLEQLNHWIRRTLYDFARDSLKPTLLAQLIENDLLRALTRLETATKNTPQTSPLPSAEVMEKAQARLRELVMGVRPDPDADLPGAVRLAAGALVREAFLQNFGHRGHHEMELAHPRWSEEPHALDSLMKQPADAARGEANSSTPPQAAPFANDKLTAAQRTALEQHLQLLHTYLALRETGKHHLMRGYALIRRILMELDQCFHLDGGIFFLTLDELPALLRGEDFGERIAQRRRQRDLLVQLPVPPVLFSDDLDAIGRVAPPAAAKDVYQGIPLSAGVVEGPALVLHELPATIPDGEAYILVCPSTDPAWMPLFVRARALVMETGGMLSHGAIVAREFGLPAVAGLPGIHHQIKTGQRLHVDGGTGKVNVLE